MRARGLGTFLIESLVRTKGFGSQAHTSQNFATLVFQTAQMYVGPVAAVILLLIVNSGTLACAQQLENTQAVNNTNINNDCNSTCNKPHGRCEENACVCEWWYTGAQCEDHWQDSRTWMLVFELYAVWTILLQTSIMIFCAYDLYVTFHYATVGGWAKWSLTTPMCWAGIVAGFRKCNLCVNVPVV